MNLKKFSVLFLSICVLFFAGAQPVLAQQPADGPRKAPKINEKTLKNAKSFLNAIRLLEAFHYYGLSDEQKQRIFKAASNAINRETTANDCHTFILDPEETASFMEHVRGDFEGIGAHVSVYPEDVSEANEQGKKYSEKLEDKYKNVPKCALRYRITSDELKKYDAFFAAANTLGAHGLLLVDIVPGSPAESAGLKAGWMVRKVNGKPLVGMNVKEASNLIRGKPGTHVALQVAIPRQNGGDILREVMVARGKVLMQHVESKIISLSTPSGSTTQIGYLKISSFEGTNLPAEFEAHLLSLPAGNLIVDLRDNPGGNLKLVDKILERLVPPGRTMLFMKFANDETLYRYLYSTKKVERLFFGNMVVLVNGKSASASEIFAGVLRDYKLATLIGEKTYGKGSVQQLFPLPDGSMLKMTIELYALPSKELIDGKGIMPDIKVTDNPNTEEDEVLQAALDFLADKTAEKKLNP